MGLLLPHDARSPCLLHAHPPCSLPQEGQSGVGESMGGGPVCLRKSSGLPSLASIGVSVGAALTQGRGPPDTQISGHTWEDRRHPWVLIAPGRSFLTGWANGLASGTEPYGSLGKGRRPPWVDDA